MFQYSSGKNVNFRLKWLIIILIFFPLFQNPGYEEVPQDVDSDDSDDETKGEGDEADPDTIKNKIETAMKSKFIACDVRACGTYLITLLV